MKTFISILRGINVGGQKKIIMAELKSLYETLKFKEVITYIQSGNVIFKANEKLSNADLEKKIEKAIQTKYGFTVPVLVRSAEEMRTVIKNNPLVNNKGIDVGKLHVTFLREEAAPAVLKSMEAYDFSPDKFIITGKEVFLHIPVSYGETKLSNTFFENKLKITATTRNWNTVNKLAEMAEGK